MKRFPIMIGHSEKGDEMKELKLRVLLCFQINDSEVFGGVGSVGYMQQAVDFAVTDEKRQIFKHSAYDYAKNAITSLAAWCGVGDESVRTISAEEYKAKAGK